VLVIIVIFAAVKLTKLKAAVEKEKILAVIGGSYL
jgi:hypothetical protein